MKNLSKKRNVRELLLLLRPLNVDNECADIISTCKEEEGVDGRPSTTDDDAAGRYFDKQACRYLVVGVIITAIITASSILLVVILPVVWAAIYVKTYDDPAMYSHYIGEDAEEGFRLKMGMDESIFPAALDDLSAVKDFSMVYCNPWDTQWLSYLVMDYDDETHDAEVNRLLSYHSSDYIGNFEVTGFSNDYTLLAMNANPDGGFVYALEDNDGRIIYVEIIFGNISLDLQPDKYIPQKYLPQGLNATAGTEYRKGRIERMYTDV